MKKLHLFILLMMASTILSQNKEEEYKKFLTYFNTKDLDFSYSLKVKVETSNPSEENVNVEFDMMTRDRKSILKYTSPKRDEGKLLLQVEGSYWMFFPKQNRSIVVAPIGALAGEISNGDLVRPPLSELYKIENYDMEGSNIKILLKALNKTAPYGSVNMWFNDGKPVKAEFMTDRGLVLKLAEYSEYATYNGVLYAAKTVISNPRNPEKKSIIYLSEPKKADFSESWFSPTGLQRVR